MKDFLEKYHKKNITSSFFIVLAALVLAFGVNFFLIDSSNFGKNIKTSVLDIKNIEKKSDLFLERTDKNLVIKNSKNMENMTDFSVSLSYNPEVIQDIKVQSDIGEISILGEKSDGIVNVILNSNGNTINPNSTILTIFTEKKLEENTNMNLINGNFTDNSGEKYELTTSGIVF